AASAGDGGGRCDIGGGRRAVPEDDTDGIAAEVEAVTPEYLSGCLRDDGAGSGGRGRDVDGAYALEVGEPDGGGKDARELLHGVDEPQLEVVGDVAWSGFPFDQRCPPVREWTVPPNGAGLVLVSGPAVGCLECGEDGRLL